MTFDRIYYDIEDNLDEIIRVGEYGTWEDVCAEHALDGRFMSGHTLVVWGETNDAGEKFFSVAVHKQDKSGHPDEQILKVFSETSDFNDLEFAVNEALHRFQDKILQEGPKGDSWPCNTKIDYLYRDADNYKVYNECVVSGILTYDQAQQILSALDDGTYFIPNKVGLPEKRFDTWDDEADHIWFELDADSFTPTSQPATVQLTTETLASSFARCKDNWISSPSLDDMIRSAAAKQEQASATTPAKETQIER